MVSIITAFYTFFAKVAFYFPPKTPLNPLLKVHFFGEGKNVKHIFFLTYLSILFQCRLVIILYFFYKTLRFNHFYGFSIG